MNDDIRPTGRLVRPFRRIDIAEIYPYCLFEYTHIMTMYSVDAKLLKEMYHDEIYHVALSFSDSTRNLIYYTNSHVLDKIIKHNGPALLKTRNDVELL